MTREQMIDEAVRRSVHWCADDATPPSAYGADFIAPDGHGHQRYWRACEVRHWFRFVGIRERVDSEILLYLAPVAGCA